MRDNQLAHGYIICHQCLVGKKVLRQMRPLSDWSEHDWYVQACSTKITPKAKKAKKSKKGKTKRKAVKGSAGKSEVLDKEAE